MDMPIGRRTELGATAKRSTAPMDLRVNARSAGERKGERGQAMFEFALLLPILMLILLGMIVFGIAMNNYLEMTNGATAGAQALAISRGQTLDPCMTVSGPFFAAAPNLTQANLKFTITVTQGGSSNVLVSNTANPSCPAANTTSPPASYLTQGATATVTVTYPCNLKIFGINFAPPTATFTAQTAESVQ